MGPDLARIRPISAEPRLISANIGPKWSEAPQDLVDSGRTWHAAGQVWPNARENWPHPGRHRSASVRIPTDLDGFGAISGRCRAEFCCVRPSLGRHGSMPAGLWPQSAWPNFARWDVRLQRWHSLRAKRRRAHRTQGRSRVLMERFPVACPSDQPSERLSSKRFELGSR